VWCRKHLMDARHCPERQHLLCCSSESDFRNSSRIVSGAARRPKSQVPLREIKHGWLCLVFCVGPLISPAAGIMPRSRKQRAASHRPCALASEDYLYPRMARMLLLRCCPLPAAPGVAACGAAACDAALRLFVVVSHAGVEKTARRRSSTSAARLGVTPQRSRRTAQTAHGTARHDR